MLQQLRQFSRVYIFLLDLFIVLLCLGFAFLVRFEFHIPNHELTYISWIIALVLGIRTVFSIYFKTYAGIVKYTSTEDGKRIVLSTLFGTITFGLINFILHKSLGSYLIPFSIVVIEFLLVVFFQAGYRLVFKTIYFEFLNNKKHKLSALVYGPTELGIIVKNMMDRDPQYNYNIVAFVEDNSKRVGLKVEGVSVIDFSDLDKVLIDEQIDQLFIAHQPDLDRKKKVIEWGIQHNIQIMNVPPVNKWINGELSINQVRNVRIEDLLERPAIKLDIDKISNELKGKRVLVTGAAGSIGSEIARQILNFAPEKLFLLDQAETPLFELENELRELKTACAYETVLADVRNRERMKRVFSVFKPEIVFHAAAYKHVPLMENNPSESILTNVQGSMIVADLSKEFDVKKMVMVSTDKAVNPTGVMGASKRIAEMYVQALDKISSEENSTRFITTRFGNVLGSNGSVIPVFRKQIQEGGPITVTHPDITRYFMTIPEACQLVLEAGAIGKGGEIMIFDMGESVKIVDLAKKMIRLSGLELGKDIEIVFSGLRPGEKLYEELLNQQENTIPTHHEKIMIAEVREYPFNEVKDGIVTLISLFETQDNNAIVAQMKKLVPEFTSNNSVFEKLDNSK